MLHSDCLSIAACGHSVLRDNVGRCPMPGSHLRPFICRALAAVVLPLLVASGGGTGPADNGLAGAATPAPTPAATAPEILRAASQRLAETQSVRFELKVDGTTYIDEAETIQLVDAAGNLVRPDRVQASFQAKLRGTINATIQIITVGETTWWTDLVTGDWTLAPEEIGYDPTVLFSDQEGLGPVMVQATNAERLEDAEVDDRPAYHVRATVSQAVIGPVTAETMSSAEVVVEVWVDRETNDLLRAVVAEQPNPETDDPATWTLDLSRFNEPVTIEPPI